jgi:hypothetical protein
LGEKAEGVRNAPQSVEKAQHGVLITEIFSMYAAAGDIKLAQFADDQGRGRWMRMCCRDGSRCLNKEDEKAG